MASPSSRFGGAPWGAVVAIAAVAVALGVLIGSWIGDAEPRGESTGPDTPVVEERSDERSSDADLALTERRPSDTDATRSIEPRSRRIKARLVSLGQQPIADAVILLGAEGFAPREIGRTNDSGVVDTTILLDRVPQSLSLAPPLFLETPATITEVPWDENRTLVATHRATLAGRVLDLRGEGVASVKVAWRLAPREDRGDRPNGKAVTDADGHFELEHAIAHPDLEVSVASRRFDEAWTTIDVPPLASRVEGIELVARPSAEHLIGRVVDEAGAPLSAKLALGPRTCTSDAATGEFALDLMWLATDGEPLVAAAEGFAPIVLPEVGAEFERRGRTHPPLTLVMQPAGVLVGIVRTHDGEPAGGAQVSVREAAPLHDRYAELHAAPSGQLTREVAADGRFRLDGLEHRPYTVIALDPETLDYVEHEATPVVPTAGPESPTIELVLPAPGDRRTVHGTAIHPDGTPATGRAVYAFLEVPGRPHDDHRFARSADVGIDGSFVLEDLPRQDLLVGAGAFTWPRRTPLPAGATRITLIVQRLCPVTLHWPEGDRPPDIGHALDARGDEVELHATRWGIYFPAKRLSFYTPRDQDGVRASELWIPESATTLVLHRGGAELLRLPISPEPDVQTSVRP